VLYDLTGAFASGLYGLTAVAGALALASMRLGRLAS
jgi:hypothetical protein